MVDGIYLEEKGKFGGKCEVSVPLENTGSAGILEDTRWAAELSLVSKLKCAMAERQRCFPRAQA